MYVLNIKWTISVLFLIFWEISPERAILGTVASYKDNESTYRRLTDGKNQITKNANSFGNYETNEFGKGNLVSSVNVSSKRLPSRTVCGPLSEEDRIFGGENTAIDEFPWLVRIKYILDNGKEVYACAGSLITDDYVLTAAHCVVNLTVKEVRLGEWNMETEHDCQDSVCSGPALDIKVTKVIPFPEYNKVSTFKGDIALLKLQRPVNFTDFIRPICLPTTEYLSQQDYTPKSHYWTAGWGKTEYAKSSPIKRKVELESIPTSECRLKQSTFEVTAPFVICAGGREGKDTCVGDSGGSLVKQIQEANSTNWFLMGVTSYGYKDCGTEGRPGLYARITPFMDWIIKNII